MSLIVGEWTITEYENRRRSVYSKSINGVDKYLFSAEFIVDHWVLGSEDYTGWGADAAVADEEWSNPQCPTEVGIWKYTSDADNTYKDAQLTVSCASGLHYNPFPLACT